MFCVEMRCQRVIIMVVIGAHNVWVAQYFLPQFNDNDNDNENTLFDHNIQIEITIYKKFK